MFNLTSNPLLTRIFQSEQILGDFRSSDRSNFLLLWPMKDLRIISSAIVFGVGPDISLTRWTLSIAWDTQSTAGCRISLTRVYRAV